MNKTHAFVIAAVLGIAVMLGLLAASRTAHLGAAARSANQAQILAEQKRLTAAEAKLKKALAKPSGRQAVGAPTGQRTVYVRPAPIIIHKHRSGEGEHEGGGSEGSND
jgi:hypothetical protein